MTTPTTTPPIVARCATPRTDAATHDDWSGGASAVEVEAAEALERDLTAAHAVVARLREALTFLMDEMPDRVLGYGEDDFNKAIIQARAALNRPDNPAEAGIALPVVKGVK